MSDKKPTKRRNALGRGLGALLEDSDTSKGKERGSGREGGEVGSINEIPLTHIETNPYQPRVHFDEDALQELAESIKTQGIIQPITVRQLDKDRFQLISGERRFQASKKAGLESIPAYVRKANDQQMLEMALIENIQRENLNPIEIALSYQRLISECDLKQEQLGERVGKNRTTVNNYLRLLRLPPDIQIALRDGKLSMGHARALINIDNIDKQLHLFNKVVREELSVRKTEALVREAMSGGEPKKAPEKSKNPEQEYEIRQLQTRLSSRFGTRVQVKADDQQKGEIKIPFVSAEDLNRILEILEEQ
ncbi:ParB/RepB/Spo0J family partition protein [Roseivirga sp. BDSF3-8]|uniref:ParB/RepB/Spo0J family partition protein n=1 Tax=Roseivirga sp. BDSF3-8 TaxID=3241598 RepID=UPI0035325FF1